MAEVPVKIQRRIRFTFVDTMDQVIEGALHGAPPMETESENQKGQAPSEPNPLNNDQRTGNRDQLRRTGFTVNELPEGDADEQEPSPISIPQVDRVARDSYPNLRAKETDTRNR